MVLLLFSLRSVSGPAFDEDEWHRLVQKPFVVWFHEGDMKNGRDILAMARTALPRITPFFEIDSTGYVVFIIASTEEEFRQATSGQIPDWGAGAADPLRSRVFLKSPRIAGPGTRLERIVAHELAHVLLARAAQGARVDRWFDEGFAQHISDETRLGDTIRLARGLVTGNVIWLEEIEGVLEFHRERAMLAYLEAKTAVDFLVESHGREVIPRIVDRLRQGMSMDEALRASIGMGFSRFQESWFEDLKTRYRWYVLLDFPLVLSATFVILFLAAFFMARRRIRQKKQM